MFCKEAYTYNHMKRNVPIIIGIIALCAVLYVGSGVMNKRQAMTDDELKTASSTVTVTGKVTRVFEGENTLEYSFAIPETATTTVEKEGSLIKVTDEGMPVLAMYISYEGGRGYSPADYITNVIVPNVPSASVKATTTIGLNDFSVVESAWSVWHVASVANGQWLLVIENKKADAEKADAVIETVTAQ